MVFSASLVVFYGSLMTLALGIAIYLAVLCGLAFAVPTKRARWRRIPRPLYVLGIVMTILFACLAVTRAFGVMEYVGISLAYGPDAYADGLRLVDKHGRLNDGRVLPDGWQVLTYTGVYVLQIWSTFPTVVFYSLFSAQVERRLLQLRQRRGTLTPPAIDTAGRKPETENGIDRDSPSN